MPALFPFANHASEEDKQEFVEELPQKRPWGPSLFRIRNIGGFLRKHHDRDHDSSLPSTSEDPSRQTDYLQTRSPSLPDSDVPLPDHLVPSRAIPSLPRPQTFRRQESEQRERLLEVPPSPTERRAVSVDRRWSPGVRASRRPLSPRPVPLPSVSAPDIANQDQRSPFDAGDNTSGRDGSKPSKNLPEPPSLQNTDQFDCEVENDDDDEDDEIDQNSLREEYDRSWILNLSMHFRDKSNREKFFVTYAETPTKWRRLTISLDYRNAPPESLEADLSTLHYQRDKSFRIYDAIRESLPDIQYYNTVTNLKLETTPEDCQLHVHVREDANEIIQYPSTSLFAHVRARRYPESELEFISHLSGFVYNVKIDGCTLIKKEIPGPDTVDEFLYEVNALDSLTGCEHVIQLEGLVTDESGSVVKGLLIGYAPNGALVDILYEHHHTSDLPWYRREKWARQIVQGLSAIHEAGFVQGDFTLSNIVIDENDDAQIIDINRRGCPVGWEPPELGRLINSGQRIGMCISVKTDLFQLGMVLWALAEEVDEPDRVDRPLPRVMDSIPAYFRRMVESCLSEHPQGRSSAKKLLRSFPPTAGLPPPPGRPSVDFVEDVKPSDYSGSSHRSDKEYIDPKMAVTLEDVNPRHRRREGHTSPISAGQVQYVAPENPDSNAASSTYRFDSSGSWIVGHRGRSPGSSRRRRSSPFARTQSSSATSLSRSPPSRGPQRRGSDCSIDQRGDVEIRGPSPKPETEPLDFESSVNPGAAIRTEHPDEQAQASERPRDKRVTAIQNEDCPLHSPLQHTDSGFDEQMDEETYIWEPPEPLPSAFFEQEAAQTSNPATPGPFYTPATTPAEQLTKILTNEEPPRESHEDIDIGYDQNEESRQLMTDA